MESPEQHFSHREQQIVDLLLQAKSIKDVAIALDLSANTVKDYAKNIYRKARVHSARELMLQVASPGRLPPQPDTGLAQFLQTAHGLDADASPAEAMAQLGAAVRRCTPARHISFWRWVRLGGELCLAADAGALRPGACLRPSGFLRRLQARGWARLERGETEATEGRQLAANGLAGEVIAVQCSSTLRVHVVLAGDVVGGAFGPLDMATIRLLARLAYAAGDHHAARMSA